MLTPLHCFGIYRHESKEILISGCLVQHLPREMAHDESLARAELWADVVMVHAIEVGVQLRE